MDYFNTKHDKKETNREAPWQFSGLELYCFEGKGAGFDRVNKDHTTGTTKQKRKQVLFHISV